MENTNNQTQMEEPKKILHDCTGACMFCGQIMAIKMPLDATDEEKDKEASYRCNCEGGQAYAKSVDRITMARKRVVNLFGPCAEDTPLSNTAVDIMLDCVEAIERGAMGSVAFSFDNGCKAKINKTTKGTIKVSRTDTTTKTFDE